MNICFLYGKIITKIEFDFVYNSRAHISVASFEMLVDKNVILINAYDEYADKVYKEYEKGDFIAIQGIFNGKSVVINQVDKID